MADRPVKKITQPMLECARLAATGEWRICDLAAHFGKSVETIHRWLRAPVVKEEYRQVLRSAEAAIVAKARRVLDTSMDDLEKANGYLALQAAQTVLQRYDAAIMGEDKQEITVRLVGGLPDIGMPDRSDSE